MKTTEQIAILNGRTPTTNVTLEELKSLILKQKNINDSSVIRISESGEMSFGHNRKSVLEENEISLHECFFSFSGNLIDERIESILPELNTMIRLKRIKHFEDTLEMVSNIIKK